MNFLKNLYKDNINRYSFHSVGWITIGTILTIVLLLLVLYAIGMYNVIFLDNYEAGDEIAWALILITFLLILPFGTFSIIYQFVSLRGKEKKYPNFRITNDFLTHNLFYQIFSVLMFFLGIFIVYSCIKTLFTIDIFETIVAACPSMCFAFIVNFLISHFCINKKINKFFQNNN